MPLDDIVMLDQFYVIETVRVDTDSDYLEVEFKFSPYGGIRSARRWLRERFQRLLCGAIKNSVKSGMFSAYNPEHSEVFVKDMVGVYKCRLLDFDGYDRLKGKTTRDERVSIRDASPHPHGVSMTLGKDKALVYLHRECSVKEMMGFLAPIVPREVDVEGDRAREIYREVEKDIARLLRSRQRSSF